MLHVDCRKNQMILLWYINKSNEVALDSPKHEFEYTKDTNFELNYRKINISLCNRDRYRDAAVI